MYEWPFIVSGVVIMLCGVAIIFAGYSMVKMGLG